jgi:hypothetical protein
MQFKRVKRTLHIIIPAIILTAALSGFIIQRAVTLKTLNNRITNLEKEQSRLASDLSRERKIKELIDTMDEGIISSAFFSRNEKYVESYIRSLLDSQGVKTVSYQGSINHDDYTEVTVTFKTGVVTLLQLIKDLESGQKLIVIKNMTLNTTQPPFIEATMKLGGYYK